MPAPTIKGLTSVMCGAAMFTMAYHIPDIVGKEKNVGLPVGQKILGSLSEGSLSENL